MSIYFCERGVGMSNNNLVLNRFFTQYVFSDLVTNHTNSTYCTVVKRYLKDEQGNQKDILTFGPVCIEKEYQRKGYGRN